jgi:hypothetical protein
MFMSVWVPVTFACMINGSCSFIYDDVAPSFEACEAKVKEMNAFMDSAPSILQYQSSCLEVELGQKT